jgi:hypothetical protein
VIQWQLASTRTVQNTNTVAVAVSRTKRTLQAGACNEPVRWHVSPVPCSGRARFTLPSCRLAAPIPCHHRPIHATNAGQWNKTHSTQGRRRPRCPARRRKANRHPVPGCRSRRGTGPTRPPQRPDPAHTRHRRPPSTAAAPLSVPVPHPRGSDAGVASAFTCPAAARQRPRAVFLLPARASEPLPLFYSAPASPGDRGTPAPTSRLPSPRPSQRAAATFLLRPCLPRRPRHASAHEPSSFSPPEPASRCHFFTPPLPPPATAAQRQSIF